MAFLSNDVVNELSKLFPTILLHMMPHLPSKLDVRCTSVCEDRTKKVLHRWIPFHWSLIHDNKLYRGGKWATPRRSVYHGKFNQSNVCIFNEAIDSIIAQPPVSLAPAYCCWNFPALVTDYSPHLLNIVLQLKKNQQKIKWIFDLDGTRRKLQELSPWALFS